MRGLETIERTWLSKKHFHGTRNLCYDVLAMTPYTDSTEHRAKLYESIHARVDEMIQNGFIDEVASLLQYWYTANSPGLKTIGYAEIIQALSGTLSIDRAIELIKQGNRNYAKRQITWCKRYASLPHISLDTIRA
jgi:tRNA dimethylallyltransferase